MNPLKKWYVEFAVKRMKILKKYNLKTAYDVANFFIKSNLMEKEPDFCPLFKSCKKCHDIPDDELNCFFCACPYYDFDKWDEDKKEFGGCLVHSKIGFRNEYGYWDCSECVAVHRKVFVKTILETNSEFLKQLIKEAEEFKRKKSEKN